MALDVTDRHLRPEVIQSDEAGPRGLLGRVVWPVPRRRPVLDRIAEEREDELKLVKVNIDEEHELASRFGVASIPTMILFKDGSPRRRRRRAAEGRDRAQPRSRELRRADTRPKPSRGWASSFPGSVALAVRVACHATRASATLVKASSSRCGSSSGSNQASSATSSSATGSASTTLHLEVEVQRRDGIGRVAVDIHPGADEPPGLALEPRLLPQLAAQPVRRRLALLEEAARHVPLPAVGLDRAAGEKDAPLRVLDERAHAGRGVRVVDGSAAGAIRN